MRRKLKSAKKPYDAPSFGMLDARAALAVLKAKGDPKDANTQKILSLVEQQLNRRKPRQIRKPDPRL